MKTELEFLSKVRVSSTPIRLKANPLFSQESYSLPTYRWTRPVGRPPNSCAALSDKHRLQLSGCSKFGDSEALDTFVAKTLLNGIRASCTPVVGFIVDPHSTIGRGHAERPWWPSTMRRGAKRSSTSRKASARSMDPAVMPEVPRQRRPAPASRPGLQSCQLHPDRGRLIAGNWADLLLFDPATVARSPNRRVNDLPAEASRLTCDAVGVEGVWINGSRGRRPGRDGWQWRGTAGARVAGVWGLGGAVAY